MADTLVQLKTKTGACTKLTLVHAQAVLQSQVKSGREDWELVSKKYQFVDNVIKRKPTNKASKKSEKE
tara:strand:- start:11210 stop:11413 length:204 start_codon:yes stop_codon:yes gene_type:complete